MGNDRRSLSGYSPCYELKWKSTFRKFTNDVLGISAAFLGGALDKSINFTLTVILTEINCTEPDSARFNQRSARGKGIIALRRVV